MISENILIDIDVISMGPWMRGNHCPSREAVYLRSNRPGVIVDRRRYCIHCGLIREEDGRSLGFFMDRLNEVQKLLRRSSRRMGVRELTVVERRLIVRSMEADTLFSDPFGSRFERQKESFVELVRGFRPDVPEPMIEDLL